MTQALQDSLRSLRASPIFALYVLAALVIAGIVGLITVGVIDVGFSHFGDPSHRTHDLTYGFLFTTTVVGLLSQLRRPEKNVAGMVMALIPAAALLLAAILSADLDTGWRFHPFRNVAAVAVVAALVHPAGRTFFRSFGVLRTNKLMLALVGAASGPWLVFASTNIGLQRTIADEHGGSGHYGFMAAFCFTVIALGLLASLRPDGWRLTAWAAGLLSALLGVTSLLYQDTVSSFGLSGRSRPWSGASCSWRWPNAPRTQRTRRSSAHRARARSPPRGDQSGQRSTPPTPGQHFDLRTNAGGLQRRAASPHRQASCADAQQRAQKAPSSPGGDCCRGDCGPAGHLRY